MNLPASGPPNLIPRDGWKQLPSDAHFVHFYASDQELVDGVCGHVGSGLLAGAKAIVIATPAHLAMLEGCLVHWGLDLDAARGWKQYDTLDAAETLDRFMDGDTPNEARFRAIIEPLLADSGSYPRTVAFGEMVSVLWREGRIEAALRLERLWNVVTSRYNFSLLCAYDAHETAAAGDVKALSKVCAAHSAVIAPTLWPA